MNAGSAIRAKNKQARVTEFFCLDATGFVLNRLRICCLERVDSAFCDPTAGGLHEFVRAQVALGQVFLKGDFDGHGVACLMQLVGCC